MSVKILTAKYMAEERREFSAVRKPGRIGRRKHGKIDFGDRTGCDKLFNDYHEYMDYLIMLRCFDARRQ